MNLKKIIASTAAVLTVASSSLLGVSAYDNIDLPKTNTAPTIDGKLDEGIYTKLHDFYKSASGADEFVDGADPDHEGKGSAYASWDDKNLYVFFEVNHDDYYPVNDPAVNASGSCAYLAILGGTWADFDENSQIQLAINLSEEGTQEFKYTSSVPEADKYNSVDLLPPDGFDFKYITVRDKANNMTYYEFALPWTQLDRAGKYKWEPGHEFVFNYLVVANPGIQIQYGQGLQQDIYDLGGMIKLADAPASAAVTIDTEVPVIEQAAANNNAIAPVATVQTTAPTTADNTLIYAAITIVMLGVALASARNRNKTK